MPTDPAFTFHCLAITTRRDPFPRVSVTAARAADVIGVAMVHLYALHGVRVSRLQVVVERMEPSTLSPADE